MKSDYCFTPTCFIHHNNNLSLLCFFFFLFNFSMMVGNSNKKNRIDIEKIHKEVQVTCHNESDLIKKK